MIWLEYFTEIIQIVAKKSTCCRRQVGAVLVKDNRIISTGYNGTPSGMKNCQDGGCPRCNSATESNPETLGECLCVHAEANAIIQCALTGSSTEGCSIYITDSPCLSCCKLLMAAKVKTVCYIREYDPKVFEIFGNYMKFEKIED